MTKTITTHVIDVVAVAIPVRDQDAALVFYTELLGLEVVADDVVGPGFRWVEVRSPGSAMAIALVAPEDGVPPGVDTGIRFTVTDAAAAHAGLSESEVDVGELLLWTGAPPMFGFSDPDGNRLYFVEEDGGPKR